MGHFEGRGNTQVFFEDGKYWNNENKEIELDPETWVPSAVQIKESPVQEQPDVLSDDDDTQVIVGSKEAVREKLMGLNINLLRKKLTVKAPVGTTKEEVVNRLLQQMGY